MSTLVGIFLHEEKTKLPRSVDSAAIHVAGGIEGDSHADEPRRNRRVLVTDAETLRAEGLEPGDLREQLAVEGLAVDQLESGSMMKIGDAVAEVIGRCAPCLTIGGYLGVVDNEAFRDSLEGKRGMFVLFSEGKRIAVGDSVSVLG